jgi:hypothetical protein
MTTTLSPRLVVSDANGVYIPQIYVEGMTEADAEQLNVRYEDVVTCQEGPDNEWYWEAWQNILDKAEFTDEQGVSWYLHQDGDLWECPDGYVWDQI